MSKVFKVTISTYTLPDGSHRTPEGKRVTKDTPGAVKVSRKSDVWYGKVNGKLSKLCSDKQASKTMLAKLLTDGALAEVGIGNVRFTEQGRRPLTDHVAEFGRFLLDRGNSKKHVGETVARVRAVLDGCGFALIRDLEAGAVQSFLANLKNDTRPRVDLPTPQALFTKAELVSILGVHPNGLAMLLRRHGLTGTGNGKKRRYPRETVVALQDRLCRGKGGITVGHYARAVKHFGAWLKRDRRTSENPFAGISVAGGKPDVRHPRRALSLPELRSLLRAASGSERVFRNLAGLDRAMLYAVAMGTGFRASELASLTPRSFDLTGPAPSARCRGAYTKNGEEAIQPLAPDLAAALRGYLDGKPADEAVWPGTWVDDAADVLRVDLEAAGIPYRDGNGEVADFHALRHSYITILVKSGVSPKLAQTLARHSTITLTMDRYTHVTLFDQTKAIGSIPALLPGRSGDSAAMQATGTDFAPRPRLDQTGDVSCVPVRSDEESSTGGRIGPDKRNSFELLAFEEECGLVGAGAESAPCRT
jgi:integrase